MPRWAAFCDWASRSAKPIPRHLLVFLPAYLAISAFALYTTLPLSLAPYQTYVELDAFELEDDIVKMAKKGEVPRWLYAYRGL